MANVAATSSLLWVHTVSVWVITLFALNLLFRYTREAVALRIQYLRSTPRGSESHSVLIQVLVPGSGTSSMKPGGSGFVQQGFVQQGTNLLEGVVRELAAWAISSKACTRDAWGWPSPATRWPLLASAKAAWGSGRCHSPSARIRRLQLGPTAGLGSSVGRPWRG